MPCEAYIVMSRRVCISLALALSGLALAGCAANGEGPAGLEPVTTGSRYVSMGSSFAAGPGVATSIDTPPNRCSRSTDNYARQLARQRGLTLVDVACSGATTTHILSPWNELSPQIEAVTPDTRLVTVTVGGNDVSFVRNLIALACTNRLQPPAGAPGGKCPTVNVPTEGDWHALAAGLEGIAREVRRRAPRARIFFVQYVQMVPNSGTCPQVPIDAEGLTMVRNIQLRLAQVTEAAARKWGVSVINPVEEGVGHDPCSLQPWATGFPLPDGPSFVPFHPNLEGMTAIAKALDRALSQ